MSLSSFLYLFGVYWPFLSVALLIGLVTGWITAVPRKR